MDSFILFIYMYCILYICNILVHKFLRNEQIRPFSLAMQ